MLPVPVGGALLLGLLALTGCRTISDVMPVGRDAYMVGAQVRGGLGGSMAVKQLAIRKADAHCAARDKSVQIVGIESSGIQGFTPQSADPTFRCE